MIRKVVQFPDPILNKRSHRVDKIDDDIKQLCKDMIETMKAENGIGISAVQVGVLLRIMVVSVKKGAFDNEWHSEVMINPKILAREGFQCLNEGCLSFPGLMLPVKRYESIDIEYQNIEGNTIKAILYGLEAVCFQHELDHLDGITFVNKNPGGLVGKII